MIKTIVDGIKPIHTPEEAAEWEAHREKGFFIGECALVFLLPFFPVSGEVHGF